MKLTGMAIGIIAIVLAVSISINVWQYDTQQWQYSRIEILNQRIAYLNETLFTIIRNGEDFITITDEIVSDPYPFIHVKVGQSFVINFQSVPVVLFIYNDFVNDTIIVTTPETTLNIPRPQMLPHYFTIIYDVFRIEAAVINIENGELFIYSVTVNGTKIYGYTTDPINSL